MWLSLTIVVAACATGVAGPTPRARAAVPKRTIWATPYDGPGQEHSIYESDDATGVVTSPDGIRVYVTGRSYGGVATGFDYATIAYDAVTGTQLWAARYSSPGTSVDEAQAVGVSPDGSVVYVTGQTGYPTPDTGYGTIAYDAATGARLWTAIFVGGDEAVALAVSPDGSTVYVTGESSFGYLTVAYEAPTGTQLWEARYNQTGSDFNLAHAVGVSPDGSRVFVTGESSLSSSLVNLDYATVAYDGATGEQLWVTRYAGPKGLTDEAFALGVRSDGSAVYVTGEVDGNGFGGDYGTFAYAANSGNLLWQARLDGPVNSIDHATDLGISPGGSFVYVTGWSDGGSSGFDYATVAYDASTGQDVWRSRFRDRYSDLATALAVSADGTRIYVTGDTATYTRRKPIEYLTIAYSNSGSMVWAARTGDNGRAVAADVATSPLSNRVYVTGYYHSSSSNSRDYGTVAYPG
jgi:outer membrane protein assembly factor BamB